MTDEPVIEEAKPQPLTPQAFMDTLIERCFSDDPVFPVIDAGNPGIIVGGPKENPLGLYLLTVRKISHSTLVKLQELGAAPQPGS